MRYLRFKKIILVDYPGFPCTGGVAVWADTEIAHKLIALADSYLYALSINAYVLILVLVDQTAGTRNGCSKAYRKPVIMNVILAVNFKGCWWGGILSINLGTRHAAFVPT
ncbi:hypothetical protein F5884DRAFT_120101 [Xylogone sp. PMI_703]|nr:hypothetical protein F5884DRAFT_120101 [Xylogone sp. PMI_703]